MSTKVKTSFKKYGSKAYFTVPAKLYHDSRFPFEIGQPLEILVVGKRILIRV